MLSSLTLTFTEDISVGNNLPSSQWHPETSTPQNGVANKMKTVSHGQKRSQISAVCLPIVCLGTSKTGATIADVEGSIPT